MDDLFAILQTIAAILHSPDTSVYVSACRILKCLPSDPSLAHKIIEMNLIPHLLSYLKSSQHPDDQLVREVFEFLEKMMLPGKLDLTPPLSSDIFAINLSLLDIKEPAHSSTCSRFLFSLLHRYPSVAFNAIIFGGFISKLVTHMDKDTVHLLIEICKQGSVYEKTSLVNEGVLRYFVQAASRMPDEEVVRILDAILVLLRTAPISPSVLSCDTVLKLHQSLSSRAPSQKFSRMIQTILSELN